MEATQISWALLPVLEPDEVSVPHLMSQGLTIARVVELRLPTVARFAEEGTPGSLWHGKRGDGPCKRPPAEVGYTRGPTSGGSDCHRPRCIYGQNGQYFP